MSRQTVGVALCVGILVSSLSVRGSEPSEDTMPPAATALLAQMDREIIATKTRTIASLDKVLKDTTKKGDLAGAMAVKASIDQLKAETEVTTSSSGRRNRPMIVGRWRKDATIFTFTPDNVVKTSDGQGGKWQTDGKTVEVAWDVGTKYRLTITAEGLVGVQISPSGVSSDCRLTLEK